MFTPRVTASYLFVLFLGVGSVGAQSSALPGLSKRADSPDPNMQRPIEALDSVFIEELTWLEVRDAVRSGKTTAIIATGGVEQNGPYLATGKHNYVLRPVTEAIARGLGDALVAPIVAHLTYNGTLILTIAFFGV